MLEKSAGENSVVEKSVVAKLCREVSEKSVVLVEKSVVAKRWTEVLDTSVGEECCTKGVGEESCRRMLDKTVLCEKGAT